MHAKTGSPREFLHTFNVVKNVNWKVTSKAHSQGATKQGNIQRFFRVENKSQKLSAPYLGLSAVSQGERASIVVVG
jgi:hypothetical protein